MVFSDEGPRSFLSHLVSDPHAQIPSDVWLSANLRIPRLDDGAFAGLSRVHDEMLRIIYGGGGAGSGAELGDIDSFRESAEIMIYMVLRTCFRGSGRVPSTS